MILIYSCEFRGFHSSVFEDSSHLVCYVALRGEWFLTF